MLSSIHPLGERARNNRFARTAVAYVAGSAAGGLATGLLAGGVGAVATFGNGPGTPALVLAAVLCGAGAALEAGPVAPLPGPRRQVNEDWMVRYRGWVYGAGFGVQLGAGVVTIVTTPLVYLALVLAALSGSPAHGAAVGAVFGAVRALPVLAVGRVDDPVRLRDVHRRVAESAEPVRRTAVVLVAVLAVVLGGVAVAGA